MLPIILSPAQFKKQIGQKAKVLRLEKNLSRHTLELKSGVPASTIKRFENSGDISLAALLRIALVLDSLEEFNQLFIQKTPLSLYKKLSKSQRQVSIHLQKHLNSIAPEDAKTRAIIATMKADEEHHGENARAAGAVALPLLIKVLMGLQAKVMTTTAYWI